MGTGTERNSKGQFTVGNKGGGRKKMPEDVKRMFIDATPEAAQLLIDTMNNEKNPLQLRLDCANKIVERVYGKAAQPLTTAEEAEGMKISIEIEGADGVRKVES